MENNKLVEVRNRDHGYVGYTIPDRNLHRSFAPGETKKVLLEELRELSYVPGGEFTLQQLLIVGDRDALSALNMDNVEPEYFYTEEDIKKILLTGSLDQLEDTLNFAPEGVINLIKDIAVKTELPDTRKRDMITKMTGFNVNNAIMVNQIMNAEDASKNEEDQKPVRKATPVTEGPSRKATLPNYKVTVTAK